MSSLNTYSHFYPLKTYTIEIFTRSISSGLSLTVIQNIESLYMYYKSVNKPRTNPLRVHLYR
jgi:hypothetical protein